MAGIVPVGGASITTTATSVFTIGPGDPPSTSYYVGTVMATSSSAGVPQIIQGSSQITTTQVITPTGSVIVTPTSTFPTLSTTTNGTVLAVTPAAGGATQSSNSTGLIAGVAVLGALLALALLALALLLVRSRRMKNHNHLRR